MQEIHSFDVAAFDNPFNRPTMLRKFQEGMSVQDIIHAAKIDTKLYLHLQVTITLGTRSSEIPFTAWAKVRPRRGCHIQIAPVLNGPLIAPLLTTIIAAAAPTIAGALFPTLAAGSLGLSLATAAISVVGTLLVRALIPPPSQTSNSAAQDDPVFTLTGASNGAAPYEAYPTVLGRHIMFPTKTATGYTETVDGDIYLRERMTFGYGPVALSDIKIGTTPITDFENVEIEFLNVDEALTLAAMPSLTEGNITVVGWRQGTEAMTLYPDDIVEDNYSVLLEKDQVVVRQTRALTRSAHVDISFQGLVYFDPNTGARRNTAVNVLVEYRRVGDPDWTTHETKVCIENTSSYVRFTSVIDFPSEGTYDIRLTRETNDTTASHVRNKSSLTAIRSIQSGQLPSHDDISEVAIRIKASNELNGQIQNLNAIVQQLAPVWDGTTWSSPQPVRHPAWQYARALMGPQLRDAVADTRISLTALKAWADEEPHWTCDLIIDKATRLAEVLDLICACGRGKRGLSDLKYSIIRDGGAGGVVQHFTPRTSWGFTGRKFLDREIHAFRVRVVSERKDWAIDEIIVYADGYDASNATEIETLSLPGIVLDIDGDNQGNAYRLARYHLAVAKLRPEEFHFYSDLDHIPCQMGDKIRVVHDVPLFGVGSGRVKSATATQIVIDEWAHVIDNSATHRLRIRKSTGGEIVVNADHDTKGVWDLASSITDIPQPDDLVMIEQMGSQPVDLLITGIAHLDELKAKITAVPAAPDVLTADTGVIPDYDPQITRNGVIRLNDPVVVQVFSGAAAADGDKVRIAVEISNPSYSNISANYHKMRWRQVGVSNWVTALENRNGTILYTDELLEGGEYEIEVRAVTNSGKFSNWVRVADTTFATLTYDVPFDVEDFEVSVLNGYATFTWRSVDPIPYRFHIKFSGESDKWENAIDVNNEIDGRTLSLPAVNGNYLIKAVSQTGAHSLNARVVTVRSADIQSYDTTVALDITASLTGEASGNVVITGNQLVFSNGGDLHNGDDFFQIGNMFTDGHTDALGYYTVDGYSDLGYVVVVRLSAQIEAISSTTSPEIFDVSDVFNLDSVFGDIPNDWIVRMEEQHTSDDPTLNDAVWTDWAPISFGNYTTRAFKFRIYFKSGADALVTYVTAASISIDVPEYIEFGRDVDCPAGGVTVDFNSEFYSTPSLVIDGQGLPSGAVPVRTITTTGFTLSYVDADDNPISASFDWHAVGFGKRGS